MLIIIIHRVGGTSCAEVLRTFHRCYQMNCLIFLGDWASANVSFLQMNGENESIRGGLFNFTSGDKV